jgi:hypothetical protein
VRALSWFAICCAIWSLPQFRKYSVMPVARKNVTSTENDGAVRATKRHHSPLPQSNTAQLASYSRAQRNRSTEVNQDRAEVSGDGGGRNGPPLSR